MHRFYKHPFKDKEILMGVYKLIFDEKYFYIGSSTDLKKRMDRWESILRSGFYKNQNIKKILPLTCVVEFEIIELVNYPLLAMATENIYLKQEWNNPLLLNQCPDAFGTKGRVYKKTNKKPQPLVKPKGKVVIDFETGIFYYSAKELAVSLQSNPKNINKIISSGKSKRYSYI